MSIDRFALTGKIALVTGASRGIGKAVALGFANAGADVAICSRKLENVEPVAGEIEKLGRQAFASAADVSNREDIERFVSETLTKFGQIDILVNNVARSIMSPIMNLREDGWDKIMNTNLKSYFLFSQAVGQIMMGQGSGVIINVSSVAGQKAAPLLGAYSVSKAGVDMLTKVLAKELAGVGVRVNAISPGMVETKFSEAIWSSPEMHAEVVRDIPLGRLATTDEIVGLAIFLASDAASYVTGTIVNIDGGSAT
ncbi:MAG: SDR family oxidoreductase [Candidatus Hydrogenedentota bacterium]|nr:MAG: SDR family oxidoreductase [Candidatus Hydrogenedentota bacterium]